MSEGAGDDARLEGVPDWILVGLVKRIHGRDGEIMVMSLTDRPERFAPGSELFLSHKRKDERIPVRVTSSRMSDRGPLITLDGFSSREEADELFGASLFVPATAIEAPGADNYFPFQLEGLEVYAGGKLVGTVTGVFESSKANPYLEVDPGGEEKLIYVPFVKKVVLSVDIKRRRIDIPEGFLGG